MVLPDSPLASTELSAAPGGGASGEDGARSLHCRHRDMTTLHSKAAHVVRLHTWMNTQGKR